MGVLQPTRVLHLAKVLPLSEFRPRILPGHFVFFGTESPLRQSVLMYSIKSFNWSFVISLVTPCWSLGL